MSTHVRFCCQVSYDKTWFSEIFLDLGIMHKGRGPVILFPFKELNT